MKVRALLLAGILFPVVCFAQTQTGNASYNAAKNGLHIAHASMSFNTRVRVTNLSNNRQVIATVDGRIPVSDPRIADISREAGDSIGMSPTGYTVVRLEELAPEHAAAPPAPAPAPPPAPVRQAAPAPAPRPAARPEPAPEPPVETIETIENIQVVSPPPVQYLMIDRPATCATSPLCVAILILVSIAVLLLTVILVLLCHGRAPLWPWYYPVWVRRHIRYKQTRRF
jgi:rare lipoprotein A